MNTAAKQSAEAFEEKVGLDRRGRRKGSRITPIALLALTIMLLLTRSFDPYGDIELVTMRIDSPADIRGQGTSLVIVAREGETLHFRVFGHEPEAGGGFGRQLVPAADQQGARANAVELIRLKSRLDGYAADPTAAEKARIIDSVLSITGVRVQDLSRNLGSLDLRKSVLGILASVSTVMLDDIPRFLWGQLKTIGVVALLSLIPGLGGMIYRRAFKQWFLLSFVVLGGINWSTEAAGIGSIAGSVKADLSHYDLYLWLEGIFVMLLLAYRLRRHAVAPVSAGQASTEGKNIVVCIDGTWNHPGQTDYGYLAETNVCKLFHLLKGDPAPKNVHFDANRCRILRDQPDSPVRQIGFYYNGVGNRVESSALGQMFGGAFGMGAEALKERAYLDVVRVYRPGDRVFIVGFSRGAAIARLLAAALSRRGAPRSLWTFRAFGRMLPVWKSARKSAERVPVKVLGCWDTVGAFGISKDFMGIKFQKINLLKDLSVAEDVERAYHMVALDETRDAFEPTLMDADPTNDKRIVEVWFSGNHANVGGGFSTDGLSDVTLAFFLEHVSSAWTAEPIDEAGVRTRGKWSGDETWGLYLRGEAMGEIEPNPMGKLRSSTGPMFTHRPRKVSLGAIISDFVYQRLQNPDLNYAPQSLFNLIKEFVEERDKIGRAVENLKQTGALSKDESKKIQEWVARYTPTKWSESPVRARLSPKQELANPFFLEPRPDLQPGRSVARPA